MAEDTRGAPKYVPQSKNDRGSIPARSSSSDQRGRPASEREGSSKDKTDSGHAPADAKKPGFPAAALATSKSDQQATVSSISPGVASSSSNTQAKTLSSPYYLSGSNSGRTPESPHGISETERLLAELTVLRGRNMPLDESQLPVSPMVERGPTASKGRSVSIDMLPSISLISPRSALRTPEPRVTSASQDAPTALLLLCSLTPRPRDIWWRCFAFMYQTPPQSRDPSPHAEDTNVAKNQRGSRRLQGLPPEHGLLPETTRKRATKSTPIVLTTT
ncbi:uncharacterized protein [Dermacentor albipictus]|uniref:uncharacterized protein isoform X1 n=1 Tax=Dermacentor albipictus TaxID=60249 RepID=UPI0038FBEB08